MPAIDKTLSDFSKLMKHEFAETDMTDSIGYMNYVLLKRHVRCSISSFVAYGAWVSVIIDTLLYSLYLYCYCVTNPCRFYHLYNIFSVNGSKKDGSG